MDVIVLSCEFLLYQYGMCLFLKVVFLMSMVSSLLDLRRYYLSILKLRIHCLNDTKNMHLTYKYYNNQLTKYTTCH